MKPKNLITITISILLVFTISCKEDKKIDGISTDGSISLSGSDSLVSNEEDVNNNQVNNTADFLKQTGIRAIMKTDGKTMVLTYDHKTKAMKISGGDMPSDSYMDTKGYMYLQIPQQGWVKINPGKMIGQMMGQLPVANIIDLPAFAQLSSSEEAQTNSMFGPIVDWPLRMTPEVLSRNQEFEKDKVDCTGGSGKCIEFKGVSGESEGVRLLFDKQEKLIQLSYKGSTINYEYDEYDVQLPDAKEFSYGK